jgi:MFS superfamily sulfate permease-like transporter
MAVEVVAPMALSTDLYPGRSATPRRVAVSVGMMNLIFAPFGGMPMCHKAGGLAGQYRFGARTNGSILFLGAVKIGISIAFGASPTALCRVFPASILGIMLACSGMEMAPVTRDRAGRSDAFAMLLTAGACLGLENIALGFGPGLAMAICLCLGPSLVEAPAGEREPHPSDCRNTDR